MEEQDIVRETSNFVFSLFKERLSKKLVYHTYKHTHDTVKEAQELGTDHNLSPADMEMLLVAAWLHDVGYIEAYEDHEAASASMAREFLQQQNYPAEKIKLIEEMILATKHGASTNSLLQEILADADMSNIGKPTFFSNAELLRVEWEIFRNKFYSDIEWAQHQLDFLLSTNFRTDIAQKKFAQQLGLNIQAQRDILQKQGKKEKKKDKKQRETFAQPKRGIETMFRATYRNHINLSSIADNKANMMISLNAVILSVIITYLGTKTSVVGPQFTEYPILLLPVGFLIATTLGSVIMAILSAQPDVTSFRINKDKLKSRNINILFFGNFTKMHLEDFRSGMHDVMREKDSLYNNMITDIYYLGEVLNKKYKLLRISYTIFMFGLILTVVSFVIAFIYKS